MKTAGGGGARRQAANAVCATIAVKYPSAAVATVRELARLHDQDLELWRRGTSSVGELARNNPRQDRDQGTSQPLGEPFRLGTRRVQHGFPPCERQAKPRLFGAIHMKTRSQVIFNAALWFVSLTGLSLSASDLSASEPKTASPLTVAEASGFRATSRSSEVVEFTDRVIANATHLRRIPETTEAAHAGAVAHLQRSHRAGWGQ